MSRPTGWGMGYIPLTEIAVYCEMYGIEGDQREEFLHVIRKLDLYYLTLKQPENSSSK